MVHRLLSIGQMRPVIMLPYKVRGILSVDIDNQFALMEAS